MPPRPTRRSSADALGRDWDARRHRHQALSGLPLHPWRRRCGASSCARRCRTRTRSAASRILLPGPTLPIVAEPAADKARPRTDYDAEVQRAVRRRHLPAARPLRPAGAGAGGAGRSRGAGARAPAAAARPIPTPPSPTYFSGGVEAGAGGRPAALPACAGEQRRRRARAGRRRRRRQSSSPPPACASRRGAARRARDAVLAIDTKPVREYRGLAPGRGGSRCPVRAPFPPRRPRPAGAARPAARRTRRLAGPAGAAVAPFPAGSGTDILARLLAEPLSEARPARGRGEPSRRQWRGRQRRRRDGRRRTATRC